MNRMTRLRLGRRRAFTLVEVVMATLFLSVVLVAAMDAASASVAAQYKSAERSQGRYLAQGLMTDVLRLDYDNITASTTTPASGGIGVSLLGLVSVQIGGTGGTTTTPAQWSQSPPTDADGNVIPGFAGWTRTLTIGWVNPSNPSTTMTVESGAKQITVAVAHNGVTVYTMTAMKVKVQ